MSITSYFKKIRALAGDKSGAALPEFAVAIFPLLWLFFVFVEVSTMFTAHLVLHHAAWVAARCGVVQKGGYQPGDFGSGHVNQDGGSNTDNGQAETVCTQAAIDATGIGFWHKTLWDISATYDYQPSSATGTHNEGYGDLVTTLKANYKCGGPVLTHKIICPNNTVPLTIVLKLPHEGAHYTLDSNRNPG